MAHGHAHVPLGDPEAPAWLWRLVERLEEALAAEGGGNASALLREASETLARLRRDGNPRTRAQARAILLVGDLVARGALTDAAELVRGELRRSFPGRAELEPQELELLQD